MASTSWSWSCGCRQHATAVLKCVLVQYFFPILDLSVSSTFLSKLLLWHARNHFISSLQRLMWKCPHCSSYEKTRIGGLSGLELRVFSCQTLKHLFLELAVNQLCMTFFFQFCSTMYLKCLLICQLLAIVLVEDSLALTCNRCSMLKCSSDLSCPGGKVMDVCGCCPVCAKVKNEVAHMTYEEPHWWPIWLPWCLWSGPCMCGEHTNHIQRGSMSRYSFCLSTSWSCHFIIFISFKF